MFIVLLRLSDASKVVTHLPGHREWLDQGFDDGVFVLTGGIPDAQSPGIPALSGDVIKSQEPFRRGTRRFRA
jgi:uncharacterized protein YciI